MRYNPNEPRYIVVRDLPGPDGTTVRHYCQGVAHELYPKGKFMYTTDVAVWRPEKHLAAVFKDHAGAARLIERCGPYNPDRPAPEVQQITVADVARHTDEPKDV